MKNLINVKNIIAVVAVIIAIIGGAAYAVYAPKADADSAASIEKRIEAQQKIEKEAVENQVKKVTNEKKIHASETTVHVGQPTSNNSQFGRTLNAYCAIPVQNDSDWAILVTVKFTVTVYDSAWKREITHEEIVQNTIMSHSSGMVELKKSYTTSEFVSGRYDIVEVREIFGKGVNQYAGFHNNIIHSMYTIGCVDHTINRPINN